MFFSKTVRGRKRHSSSKLEHVRRHLSLRFLKETWKKFKDIELTDPAPRNHTVGYAVADNVHRGRSASEQDGKVVTTKMRLWPLSIFSLMMAPFMTFGFVSGLAWPSDGTRTFWNSLMKTSPNVIQAHLLHTRLDLKQHLCLCFSQIRRRAEQLNKHSVDVSV